MTDRGDDYYDDSLDSESLEHGNSDDEHAEDVEPIEEASTPAAIVVSPDRSAEDEELLSEIEKAGSKSKGVGALILTVLISGVLFVAVGTVWWSWTFTLTLVPVLLIHELGHFVTMKAFRYRNVNMFFIPLLGAAVTGQQFNVPAWKKALVALMGPLPSIFLATGTGIAAIVLQLDWLVYACIVALVVNGLNLVPLLPFDGGHVLHAVLFCRHYYLDVALRAVTILIILLLAFTFGGSAFLIGLAVFLLMTIHITIRNGQIASQLRSEGDLDLVTEDDRVAPGTALRIADALRARIKAKITAKTLAQHTLQVVEQINTRPPGILASMGLLFIHGAGVLVAAVAALGLGVAVNEEFQQAFLVGLYPRPLYQYDCDPAETSGDQYVPTYGTKSIIATFATIADANRAYVAAKPEMSSQDHLQRFGRSVSISLEVSATPKTMQSWIDRWEASSQELLVDSPYAPTMFSLDATFSDGEIALRVEKELRAYFENTYRYTLNPPWQPSELVRDPAENEHYKARASLLTIDKIAQKAVDEEQRSAAAKRIGDFEEVDRIRQEVRRDAVAKFKATKPDIDIVTVDLYLKASTWGSDVEAQRALIERMGGTFVDYDEEYEEVDEDERVDEDVEGSVDVDDGAEGDRAIGDDGDTVADDTSGGDDIDDDDNEPFELNEGYERYGGTGEIIRNSKTVSLRNGQLSVTAEGARAIADWLCALGATDITYAFYTYDE